MNSSDTYSPLASESLLRATVRDKYAAVARGEAICHTGCGCGPDDLNMIGDAYEGVEGHIAEADLNLGCGVPTEYAGLAPGQTVLDLGSGAGNDAFIARRLVGEKGRVIGVDFTPEMIARARRNAETLGFDNVAFVEGSIEALPLPDAGVDVVLSNCVLNLVPDKARAFAEIYRVLRPGGHLCISDVVSRGTFPEPVRASASLYAGCVAGAVDEAAYLEVVRRAGFAGVEVCKARRIEVPDAALPTSLSDDERAAFRAGGLWSLTLRARKPAADARG